MAQAGYTPIQLYYSTTASAAPSSGNLANGELAINITDGKLFYKDNSGTVRVLAGTGGTGVVAGSNTQVQFNNNGVFGASSGLTWDGTNLTASQLRSSGLTSGRVTYASTSGLLVDSANMTFNGTRLTVADLADSSLTSGRVTYATTGGNLTDSANLTFDGTNLTLGGGTANGVAYLNGSKVLTTGSALTFDGTVLLSGAGGTGTSNSILKLSGSSASNYGSYLQFLRNNVPTWSIGNDSAINGGSSDDLTIYGTASQRFYASASEQMRLTSTGLGIGTSSPAYKLDVQSTGYPIVQVASTSASGANGSIFQSKNGGGAASFFGTETTTGSYSYTGALANAAYVGSGGSNPLQLITNSAARVTIDSVGNFNLLAGNIYTQSTSGIFFTGTVGNFNNGIYGIGTNNVAIAAGGSERARIDSSGNLLVGFTAGGLDNSGSFQFSPGTSAYGGSFTVNHSTSNINGSGYINFGYNGSAIGSISQNGTTGVLYNITSDYRLKNVLGAVTGAGARIDALEPIEYEWKSDGTRTRGFLAHKFQEVYPHSVTGEKDAVDAEGNPVYQQMQGSTNEVIADLVAELQSLRARVAQLESN